MAEFFILIGMTVCNKTHTYRLQVAQGRSRVWAVQHTPIKMAGSTASLAQQHGRSCDLLVSGLFVVLTGAR
ncbi:hypothetical protein BDV59DRAFT_177368 [Aspergillus ambiguus]|uniref:uncharacterized protein n=1 Tax=Aspergillus ambiguus TaxID=176160 RepID=UPI003CCDB09C